MHIHTELYKARPDIRAIAHFHHDLATTFSVVEGVTLQPIKNHAVRWASGMPIHPDPDHVRTPEQGRDLALTLGPHHALTIRAHGQVVAAEALPALLMDCIHFVENAEALYHASMLGRVVPLTAAELERVGRAVHRTKHSTKLWKYYVERACSQGLLPTAWKSLLETNVSTN